MHLTARSFALALVVLPASLSAQSPAIDAAVERYTEEAIAFRHWIHENPELGFQEFEAARRVADHMRELGLEVRTGVGQTGVIGILRGGRPGPVVAVRADMDALPVTEDTGYEFASTVRTTYLGQDVGVMHACGHDVHTAVQYGVVSVLASMRDEIPGTVLFIFQPAEEGVPGEDGGAKQMLDDGAFSDPRPSAVFGLHTAASMKLGTLGYAPGPMLAAADFFRITIHGKQSHGAYPHLGIDPIVMAAQVVMAFQTIRSRNLPALEPSVVTVGLIHGGTRNNIIPDTVHMQGTVRTYNEEVRDAIERRMGEILEGITMAGGGTYEFDYQRGVPATLNDIALTERMAPTLAKVVGDDNVSVLDPVMGGEDFSYFANEVPGFFFRLGMVKEGTESGGHHTATFRADDGSVPVGMRAMANLLMDYLRTEAGLVPDR